jgi:transposase
MERDTVAIKSNNLMKRQRARNLAGKLMDEWQNIDAVAEVLGCHPNNVRRWHIEYKSKSSEDNGSAKEPGRPSKLSLNQQKIIEDILLTKTPGDMNHPKALWSNRVIRDIIRDLFRTELSLGTVNNILHKLGIVRRQIFRPDRNHMDVEHSSWLNNRLPSIRKLAKEQSAHIFYIYDNKIIPTCPQPATCCYKGDYDGRNQPTSHCEIGVLSAICPRNSQRFMSFLGPLNQDSFVEFLDNLICDTDRHLFLIAEPHYRQFAMEIDPYLSSNIEKISLFFLPEN